MSGLTSAATFIYGTERMRQKLFMVASGGLVNTSAWNDGKKFYTNSGVVVSIQ